MTEVKKTTVAKKATPVKKTTVAAPKKVATPKPVASKSGKVVAPKLNNATYATGKRKDSVARVYLVPGRGNIIVNDKAIAEYFRRDVLQMIIAAPFEITKRVASYDVVAMVSGGGLSGQAGALRHGISKALQTIEPDLRKALKEAGFITRDSRVVERKHYGFHKARRSTQFSKR